MNAKNKDWKTPLRLAIECGKSNVVEFLKGAERG